MFRLHQQVCRLALPSFDESGKPARNLGIFPAKLRSNLGPFAILKGFLE